MYFKHLLKSTIFSLVMNSILRHINCVVSAPEGQSSLNRRQKEKRREHRRSGEKEGRKRGKAGPVKETRGKGKGKGRGRRELGRGGDGRSLGTLRYSKSLQGEENSSCPGDVRPRRKKDRLPEKRIRCARR